MKKVKVKTKWRLEWWTNGRKSVKHFGSRGQASQYAATLRQPACRIDISSYQERSETL